MDFEWFILLIGIFLKALFMIMIPMFLFFWGLKIISDDSSAELHLFIILPTGKSSTNYHAFLFYFK